MAHDLMDTISVAACPRETAHGRPGMQDWGSGYSAQPDKTTSLAIHNPNRTAATAAGFSRGTSAVLRWYQATRSANRNNGAALSFTVNASTPASRSNGTSVWGREGRESAIQNQYTVRIATNPSAFKTPSHPSATEAPNASRQVTRPEK